MRVVGPAGVLPDQASASAGGALGPIGPVAIGCFNRVAGLGADAGPEAKRGPYHAEDDCGCIEAEGSKEAVPREHKAPAGETCGEAEGEA